MDTDHLFNKKKNNIYVKRRRIISQVQSSMINIQAEGFLSDYELQNFQRTQELNRKQKTIEELQLQVKILNKNLLSKNKDIELQNIQNI
jgi:hypothetical protein